MAEESIVREKLRLMFGTVGGDVQHAEELYLADAVLEFPQSGERFEGRAGFTQWRSRYPADVTIEVRRVSVRTDLAVVELAARYDGGTEMFGVAVMEFRGDRIAHERIYVCDGWEAPEWRVPWRSPHPVETSGI